MALYMGNAGTLIDEPLTLLFADDIDEFRSQQNRPASTFELDIAEVRLGVLMVGRVQTCFTVRALADSASHGRLTERVRATHITLSIFPDSHHAVLQPRLCEPVNDATEGRPNISSSEPTRGMRMYRCPNSSKSVAHAHAPC